MSKPIACLGSGEFEPWTEELDRLLLSRATGDGTVALLPTASALDGGDVFKAWGAKGIQHYQALKAPARVIEIGERSDAFRVDFAEQLQNVSMIFLSGGKPDYLAETLIGTLVWQATLDAWRRGAALVGCSAGMCYFGSVPHWDVIDEQDPTTRPALLNGFLGDRTLVGVSEQTAFGRIDGQWKVFGSGSVVVVKDGNQFALRPGDTFDEGALPLTLE